MRVFLIHVRDPQFYALPAKTRAFVDFIVEAFQRQDLARRFSAK